jgi:hypothetical protein
MPERDCPDGLYAEHIDERIAVYGAFASATMSPESALQTADRLRLAAEEALALRERRRARNRAA